MIRTKGHIKFALGGAKDLLSFELGFAGAPMLCSRHVLECCNNSLGVTGSLCSTKAEFFLSWASTKAITLQVGVVVRTLHERPHKIIDGRNIQITATVSKLLKPFVMDCLGEVARWHLCRLRICETLREIKKM